MTVTIGTHRVFMKTAVFTSRHGYMHFLAHFSYLDCKYRLQSLDQRLVEEWRCLHVVKAQEKLDQPSTRTAQELT